MKEYVLIGLVVVVLILSVAQSFQIYSLKEDVTIDNSGVVDMGGWTEDEKMMYEHHGTMPARLQGGNSQPQSGGMVGGC